MHIFQNLKTYDRPSRQGGRKEPIKEPDSWFDAFKGCLFAIRSYTQIILSDFDDEQYSSACFDLFENGEPLDRRFADDQRFWSPYLREKFGM
jgi:hypothetical protein